jgi:hypothetical protein
MNIGQGKVFEKAVGGSYLGTIIDVVDMPNQTSTINGVLTTVDRVRIQWVLSHINGAPYLDKENQPMTVVAMPTAKMAPKSKLYKLLVQILNAAPPLITSTEDLARLLLGRSNQLFLTQEPSTKVAGEFYTNVAGIAPLPPGVAGPQAPAGFVRQQNRPKTQAGLQGQPVQTYAAPQTQQFAPPPANNVSFAPVPQPGAPIAPQAGKPTGNEAF